MFEASAQASRTDALDRPQAPTSFALATDAQQGVHTSRVAWAVRGFEQVDGPLTTSSEELLGVHTTRVARPVKGFDPAVGPHTTSKGLQGVHTTRVACPVKGSEHAEGPDTCLMEAPEGVHTRRVARPTVGLTGPHEGVLSGPHPLGGDSPSPSDGPPGPSPCVKYHIPAPAAAIAAMTTAAISMVPGPMPEELVVEEKVVFVAAVLVRDCSVEFEMMDEVELINTGGPVDEEEQVELVLEEVVVAFDVEEADWQQKIGVVVVVEDVVDDFVVEDEELQLVVLTVGETRPESGIITSTTPLCESDT
jgi:hypothetical protein